MTFFPFYTLNDVKAELETNADFITLIKIIQESACGCVCVRAGPTGVLHGRTHHQEGDGNANGNEDLDQLRHPGEAPVTFINNLHGSVGRAEAGVGIGVKWGCVVVAVEVMEVVM